MERNTSTRENNKTLAMIMIALFAAVTGVLSWISIPLPFTPIPINLALVGVLLAGNTLGAMGKPNAGAAAMLVYIAMGAMGVPVFSGGNAGVGVLVGPTGGFIAGYIVTALIAGHICSSRQRDIIVGTTLNFIAILACYALGLAWFMISTGATLMAGLTACVFPFLLGDLFKSIAVAIVSGRVNKLIR